MNLRTGQAYQLTLTDGSKFSALYQSDHKEGVARFQVCEGVLFLPYTSIVGATDPTEAPKPPLLRLCPRCGGKGKYRDYGRCFTCGGKGSL